MYQVPSLKGSWRPTVLRISTDCADVMILNRLESQESSLSMYADTLHVEGLLKCARDLNYVPPGLTKPKLRTTPQPDHLKEPKHNIKRPTYITLDHTQPHMSITDHPELSSLSSLRYPATTTSTSNAKGRRLSSYNFRKTVWMCTGDPSQKLIGPGIAHLPRVRLQQG